MWLLLKGLADSMRTLFWTAVVILFVNYIFGIVAAIMIGDSVEFDRLKGDPVMGEYAAVQEYFSGLDMCLFTLLQMITGDGWASNIARPVMKIKPSMWLFFAAYV